MSESILFTNAKLFTGVDEEAVDGGAVWVGRAPEGGALLVLRLPGHRPPSG